MNSIRAVPRTVKEEWNWLLLVAALCGGAALVSLLPLQGAGGHLHWLLYMVATHRLGIAQAIGMLLSALPGYIRGLPWIIEGVRWIITWVAYDGIGAIGTILATMSATGWGGIIIAIAGVAFLG
ncbi:hypothetical protein [Thermogemmatispora onikobensis]|uniref:hypothetical protein n=1 Tax=Thermogemmatispora onikobensis TaxID=732234 RepID=UPI00085358E1|nr:hypothetical protein [Thermogemmatispora onikobensis]